MKIFKNETLNELIKTGEHCIHEDFYEYLVGPKKMIIEKLKRDYKIAIIIPNYNYSKWLDKCLNSVLRQTYKNYEVIFVDDCSTDNSLEIVKSYKNKIPIKIIALKQKRYNGGARNEAYLHLSKDVDYVWYLDSDDWLANEFVLEKINDNLGADVLFVGIGTDIHGVIGSYYLPNYMDKYQAIKGWSGSCGKVIQKDLALSQLYQEGTLKEDRTHHYKICVHMKSFKLLKEIVYIWNKNNEKSVTTERNNKWKADTIRNWADSIEMYENEKGHDIKMDLILQERVNNCKNEVMNNEDSQQ